MTEKIESKNIYEILSFNVKGVTFENEDGKDIQKEIRKIFLEYEHNGCFEKYSGYSNSEIKEFVSEVSEFEDAEIEMKLKEDVYENKPCIKIFIEKYDGTFCHVGYVPKNMINQYFELKKAYKDMEQNIKLVGGKIKQLAYNDENKEVVEIVELNYGFEITLIFYDDKTLYEEEKERQRNKIMAEYEKKKREIEEREEEKRLEEERINEEKRLKEEEKKKKLHNEIRKKKKRAKFTLIVYSLLLIVSILIMPVGIITLIWAILGIIASILMMFEH